MNISAAIIELTAHARRVHGADIYISVARAEAFGHDDNLIIVNGKNHALVAADIARVAGKGAKIVTETGNDFATGAGYTYSTVQFK